jgi:hypothetical protein
MEKLSDAKEKLIKPLHEVINAKSENYKLNLLTYQSTILNPFFDNRYQGCCRMYNEIVSAPE